MSRQRRRISDQERGFKKPNFLKAAQKFVGARIPSKYIEKSAFAEARIPSKYIEKSAFAEELFSTIEANGNNEPIFIGVNVKASIKGKDDNLYPSIDGIASLRLNGETYNSDGRKDEVSDDLTSFVGLGAERLNHLGSRTKSQESHDEDNEDDNVSTISVETVEQQGKSPFRRSNSFGGRKSKRIRRSKSKRRSTSKARPRSRKAGSRKAGPRKAKR
jgi:hypothetical protein